MVSKKSNTGSSKQEEKIAAHASPPKPNYKTSSVEKLIEKYDKGLKQSIDRLVASCCVSYRKLHPVIGGVDVKLLMNEMNREFMFIQSGSGVMSDGDNSNGIFSDIEGETSNDSFIDDSDLSLSSDSDDDSDSDEDSNSVLYVDENGCVHID